MSYIKFLPYILIATLLSYGVYKWKDMQNTISEQKTTIKNKILEIDVLNENIKIQKVITADEKSKAIFEALSDSKKLKVKDNINYDKNKSISINSTRFYL